VLDLLVNTLAYRPFLDPMTVADWWWWLVLPLIIGISVVYKAIRLPNLKHYWWHVLRMTIQVIVAMIIMCIILYVIVLIIAPRFF
jgi:hypothetical protein